jgi:hypothetical protein
VIPQDDREAKYIEEEKYLFEMLRMLQESYAKAAQPYIDRLVTLKTLRIPCMVLPWTPELAHKLDIVGPT